MDERLSAVREEIDSGRVSPRSLVLLFNAASDAGHDGDLAALEETLALARAVAGAGSSFRADAERLVAICEDAMSAIGRDSGAAVAASSAEPAATCPDCGNEVAANAVRCRRCGHLFD